MFPTETNTTLNTPASSPAESPTDNAPSSSFDNSNDAAPSTSLNGEQPGEAADSTTDAAASEPWHKDPRWQEWQEQKKDYERLLPFAPVAAQFREMGMNDADTVFQTLQQRQEEAAIAEEEAAIADRVAREYDPETNPDDYDRILRAEVTNNRQYRIEMSQAEQAAKQEYPSGDLELTNYVAQAPKDIAILMRHTHERIQKERKEAGDAAVAAYIEQQAKARAVPTPEGAGGDPLGATGAPPKKTDWGRYSLGELISRTGRTA